MAGSNLLQMPDVRLTGCFPELSGFVLLDPRRLEDAVPQAKGRDLMTLLCTSDLGNRVTADGVAILMLNLTVGYYTVTVGDRRSLARPAGAVASTGWVLGTDTGTLLLCGAGYLTEWDPEHEKHRPISVSPGWYRLDIDGYPLGADSDDDYALDLTLTPAAERPPFAADLAQDFSLDDG